MVPFVVFICISRKLLMGSDSCFSVIDFIGVVRGFIRGRTMGECVGLNPVLGYT